MQEKFRPQSNSAILVSKRNGCPEGYVTGVEVDLSEVRLSGVRYRGVDGRTEYRLPSYAISVIGWGYVTASVAFREEVCGDASLVLQDLRGAWVMSTSGYHFGTFVDLFARPPFWDICELRLSGSRCLSVADQPFWLGGDEIVVSGGSTLRVGVVSPPGILARLERGVSCSFDRFGGASQVPISDPAFALG
jgi:hypothetical protein